MSQFIDNPLQAALAPVIDDLLVEIRKIVREEIGAIQESKQAPDGYLSRQEVADRLKVTLQTLLNWTNTGRLKGYRIGRRKLYKVSEVDQALNAIKV